MKVLLVQPKKPPKAFGGEDFAIFEPLALEYVAAGIRENHDVKILDMRLDDDIDSVLGAFRPDLVGITAYTVHVNVAKGLFEKIKKANPDIFTVVGGHHASVSHQDFLSPFIDLIVIGEGVFPFQQVVARLEAKKDLNGIAGTVYKGNGNPIVNPFPVSYDLDSIPLPDRKLTRDYRQHYFSEWMRPIASLRTSKGCPFRCNFCALWKLAGRKYLARSPEKVVEELARLEEKFVFFADDESFIDVKRMKMLADLIQQSGIKKHYYSYIRSDTTVKRPELIEQWKKIGLERAFLGLEYFRDEDLKNARKGSTVGNNIEAVKILKSLDIEIFPAFIIKPEFDKSDFQQLCDFSLKLGFNFVGFSTLTPLPGTDLYDETRDRFITHNYDYFDFIHTILPTKLPIREFYREFQSLYGRTRSISDQIAFIRKYPLSDFPSLFKMYFKFNRQLANIYKDYLE